MESLDVVSKEEFNSLRSPLYYLKHKGTVIASLFFYVVN